MWEIHSAGFHNRRICGGGHVEVFNRLEEEVTGRSLGPDGQGNLSWVDQVTRNLTSHSEDLVSPSGFSSVLLT